MRTGLPSVALSKLIHREATTRKPHAEAVGLEGETVLGRTLGKPLFLVRGSDMVADGAAPISLLDILDGVGGEAKTPDGSLGDTGQERLVVARLSSTIWRAELGNDAGELRDLLAENQKPQTALAAV